MTKQMLVKCVCGKPIDFPEGQVKAKCNCGATWECGVEGYWYMTTNFAPISTNRMRPRNKRKRRAMK